MTHEQQTMALVLGYVLVALALLPVVYDRWCERRERRDRQAQAKR